MSWLTDLLGTSPAQTQQQSQSGTQYGDTGQVNALINGPLAGAYTQAAQNNPWSQNYIAPAGQTYNYAQQAALSPAFGMAQGTLLSNLMGPQGTSQYNPAALNPWLAQSAPYQQQVIDATKGVFDQQNAKAWNNLTGNAMQQQGIPGSGIRASKLAYNNAVMPGQEQVLGDLNYKGYLAANQSAQAQEGFRQSAQGLNNTTASTIGGLTAQQVQALLGVGQGQLGYGSQGQQIGVGGAGYLPGLFGQQASTLAQLATPSGSNTQGTSQGTQTPAYNGLATLAGGALGLAGLGAFGPVGGILPGIWGGAKSLFAADGGVIRQPLDTGGTAGGPAMMDAVPILGPDGKPVFQPLHFAQPARPIDWNQYKGMAGFKPAIPQTGWGATVTPDASAGMAAGGMAAGSDMPTRLNGMVTALKGMAEGGMAGRGGYATNGFVVPFDDGITQDPPTDVTAWDPSPQIPPAGMQTGFQPRQPNLPIAYPIAPDPETAPAPTTRTMGVRTQLSPTEPLIKEVPERGMVGDPYKPYTPTTTGSTTQTAQTEGGMEPTSATAPPPQYQGQYPGQGGQGQGAPGQQRTPPGFVPGWSIASPNLALMSMAAGMMGAQTPFFGQAVGKGLGDAVTQLNTQAQLEQKKLETNLHYGLVRSPVTTANIANTNATARLHNVVATEHEAELPYNIDIKRSQAQQHSELFKEFRRDNGFRWMDNDRQLGWDEFIRGKGLDPRQFPFPGALQGPLGQGAPGQGGPAGPGRQAQAPAWSPQTPQVPGGAPSRSLAPGAPGSPGPTPSTPTTLGDQPTAPMPGIPAAPGARIAPGQAGIVDQPKVPSELRQVLDSLPPKVRLAARMEIADALAGGKGMGEVAKILNNYKSPAEGGADVFGKKLGEDWYNVYTGRQKEASAARGLETVLGQFSRSMDTLDSLKGVNTGKLSQLKGSASNVLQQFGIDATKLGLPSAQQAAELEVVRALGSQMTANMAKALQSGENGRGQAGRITDADIRLFSQSEPNIDNTPQGNRMLVSILRERNQLQYALWDAAKAAHEQHPNDPRKALEAYHGMEAKAYDAYEKTRNELVNKAGYSVDKQGGVQRVLREGDTTDVKDPSDGRMYRYVKDASGKLIKVGPAPAAPAPYSYDNLPPGTR